MASKPKRKRIPYHKTDRKILDKLKELYPSKATQRREFDKIMRRVALKTKTHLATT